MPTKQTGAKVVAKSVSRSLRQKMKRAGATDLADYVRRVGIERHGLDQNATFDDVMAAVSADLDLQLITSAKQSISIERLAELIQKDTETVRRRRKT